MHKIPLLALVICIAAIGCSKKSNDYVKSGTGKDSVRSVPALQGAKHIRKNEDDEKPIVIDNTKDHIGVPISGSVLTYISGTDTIIGITDNYGQCISHIPTLGDWILLISNPGYACISEQISIVDSVTMRVDTLFPGICP